METNSILASSTIFSTASIHHHPHSFFPPQQPQNRARLLCSFTRSETRRPRSICTNTKTSSFRGKGALRDNVEGTTGSPASVPVRVAQELLLAGHRYLDVRTPEEFSAGHAVGAINIPYMYRVRSGMTRNTKFLEEVSAHFGKFDEIIVGCQSGKRSMMAATDLLAAGFTGVTDIAGGFAAWRQNELPIEE